MTEKLLIDRELLERVAKPVLFRSHEDAHADACAELRAILAQSAPADGEAVEVVAWQDAENPLYTTGERRQMHAWATDGYPIRELMTVAQHQRIVAQRDAKLAGVVEALRAADEYLSDNPFNEIGSRSILHRQMKDALADWEKTNA